MIPAEDANRTRINRLFAQILRALEHAIPAVLLKALFNDSPLIFVRKCGHSAGYFGRREG
jgi:hypothetical protein